MENVNITRFFSLTLLQMCAVVMIGSEMCAHEVPSGLLRNCLVTVLLCCLGFLFRVMKPLQASP